MDYITTLFRGKQMRTSKSTNNSRLPNTKRPIKLVKMQDLKKNQLYIPNEHMEFYEEIFPWPTVTNTPSDDGWKSHLYIKKQSTLLCYWKSHLFNFVFQNYFIKSSFLLYFYILTVFCLFSINWHEKQKLCLIFHATDTIFFKRCFLISKIKVPENYSNIICSS